MNGISFQYFLDNQQMLYERWPDRYLVISGTKVATTGTDYMDAFAQAQRIGLLPGEFIIQLCGPDERCYTAPNPCNFEY